MAIGEVMMMPRISKESDMCRVQAARLIACLIVAVAVSPSAAVTFSELALDEARVVARNEGKVRVVVAVSAQWPEQGLRRATWYENTLVAWLAQHAIVLRVDVDAQDELAAELMLWMPGEIVAWSADGLVKDQLDSDAGAARVLSFLVGVKAGRSRIERLTGEVEERPRDVFVRLDLADTLVEVERWADALLHFEWLWRNAHINSDLLAYRLDYLADGIIALIDAHPPAADAFRKLRDEAADRMRGGKTTWADFDEWIMLNDLLDDTAATVGWWDRFKDDPAAARAIEKHVELIEYALTEQHRWAEVLQLYPDPMAVVRGAIHEVEQAVRDAKQWDTDPVEMRAMMLEHLRDRAGLMHAALLAAGREDEAKQIADTAIGADDSVEMKQMLAQYAADADQLRPMHEAWQVQATQAPDAPPVE
jgi:hypothetical protein